MKIQIEINDSFAQDLLSDTVFLSELSLVHNDSNIITELWVKNKVVNNDVITFSSQVLEMIKGHYCRISDSDPKCLTISYEGNKPKGILFTGTKYKMGHLVKIKTIENE